MNTITEEKEETGSSMMLQPLFESPERKNGEFNVALETKKLQSFIQEDLNDIHDPQEPAPFSIKKVLPNLTQPEIQNQSFESFD